MADEELHKLCEALRAWGSTPALTDPGSFSLLGVFVRNAADEIERLAKEITEMKAFAATQSETIRFYMDQAEKMYG